MTHPGPPLESPLYDCKYLKLLCFKTFPKRRTFSNLYSRTLIKHLRIVSVSSLNSVNSIRIKKRKHLKTK